VQPKTAQISEDSSLVEQCRHGDSAALERLIVRYHSRIYNTILRICTNADDAAELTQETFVKVIENIGDFEGRSGFYTWVFRIAVNLTLNYCQRGSRLAFRSLDAENDEENEQAKGALKAVLSSDDLPDPATVAANKELCQIVLKALKKLDDAQRAVIVLRDIEGMNYAQIGEVLKIELGTVKSRISRARNSLREILGAIVQ
jgi:RNA polymerase sigma-70 factor (ECF subfamily)